MIVHKTDQGGEIWDNLRRIRPTASRFSEIITPKEGKMSKSAANYAAELVMQSMFDADPDAGSKWAGNSNTENGHEREDASRCLLSSITGRSFQKIGFITTDDGFIGCSPDAVELAGDLIIEGGELKNPMGKTHAQWVLDGVLPDDHKVQVHCSMYVTGLRRWHFLSSFPSLQPLHLIVEWDDYTDKLAKAADDFRILYHKTKEKLISKLTPKK